MKKSKISAIKKTLTRFVLSFVVLFFLQIIFFSFPVKAEVPVVTLLGYPLVAVDKGTDYIDAGATADDAEDGDLTEDIVVSNPVDTSVSGYYMVAYRVVDSDDNISKRVGRIVAVVDKTLPIIFTDNIAPSAPVANPAAGYYDDDQKVYLSSSDKESGLNKIYYTTDGAVPSKTSQIYSSAIEVDQDMTIRAIAYDKADNKSGMLEAKYEIEKGSNKDDDDDDDDDDDNSPKQKVINITVPASSSTDVSDNNESGSDTEGQVEGEQVNVASANNTEEAPEETQTTLLKSKFIWWIIAFLLLSLILGIFLWVRERRK